MKLVRFGAPGREKPGIIDAEGHIRDLSKVVPDLMGDALSPRGRAKSKRAARGRLPVVKGKPRIGPCVGRVGNLIAIGLNYSDHADETGMHVPNEQSVITHA